MVELQPEKKQQCKEIFDYYDKDRDGKLTEEEFGDAMKSFRIFIGKEEMASILEKLAVCDYAHFEEIAAKKLSQKVNKDEIINGLYFLDEKKTGKIPHAEMKRAFLTLGDPLKESEVDQLLKEFTDKDNNVDYKKMVIALVGK